MFLARLGNVQGLLSAGNKDQIYGTLMCPSSKSQPRLYTLLLSHTRNLVPELWMDRSLTPDQGSHQLQQFGFSGVLCSLSHSKCTKTLCSPLPFSLLPDSFCPIQVVPCCYVSDYRAAASFNSFPVNNSQIQSILSSLKGVFPEQPHFYSQHIHNLILMVPQRDTFCLGETSCDLKRNQKDICHQEIHHLFFFSPCFSLVN